MLPWRPIHERTLERWKADAPGRALVDREWNEKGWAGQRSKERVQRTGAPLSYTCAFHLTFIQTVKGDVHNQRFGNGTHNSHMIPSWSGTGYLPQTRQDGTAHGLANNNEGIRLSENMLTDRQLTSVTRPTRAHHLGNHIWAWKCRAGTTHNQRGKSARDPSA